MKDRRLRVETALNDCASPQVTAAKRIEAIDTLSEILSIFTGLRLE